MTTDILLVQQLDKSVTHCRRDGVCVAADGRECIPGNGALLGGNAGHLLAPLLKRSCGNGVRGVRRK